MSDRGLSLSERALLPLARGLASLPGGLQRALSGRGPTRIDGLTLLPEIQLILALRARLGARPFHTYTPEALRELVRRESRLFAGRRPPLAGVKDLWFEGPAGRLAARHYAPAGASSREPLLVYFHGGGMVFGDVETHDALCALLCHAARVHVLSLEYRLAPEAPFPAGLDDARAGYAWAARLAAELGADPDRLAVGGDSAGGTLAAVVCQLWRGEPRAPAAQLLFYPATDRSAPYPSHRLFAEGFLLGQADVEWFARQYAAQADATDPLLSPLLAEDLSGLPPALIATAGFDPLRDEGEAYAVRLEAAGVRVVHRRWEGLVHGFANLTSVSPASREAVAALARRLRGLFNSRLERQSEPLQRRAIS